MEHPDLQKQRIKADQRFNDEEANDILKRAAEIESKTAFSTTEGLSGEELERGANRAGISDDAIEAAIREREAQKKAEAVQAQYRERWRQRALMGAMIGSFVVVASAGVSFWRAQSTLSSQAALVESQRAQIETVLQRRHDLVPNLVRATQAAQSSNDKTAQVLQTLLQKAQNAASPEEKMQAEKQLADQVNQALSILNKSENNQLTARLQDSWEGSENRVAQERRRYNKVVSEYNRVAGSFPTSFWRPMLGYPPSQPLFKADAAAQTAPQFPPPG